VIRLPTTLLGGLILMLAGLSVQSQPLYVIDHLAIGLHESQSLASPILRVLPTGTSLDVLLVEENFVRVRTDDGVEGWVDATYVMEERPAQLALLELEAEFVDSKHELEVAHAEIESLTAKLESLKNAQAGQASNEKATSDALREMQRLAQENQTLMNELDELKSTDRQPQVGSASNTPSTEGRRRPPVVGGFLGLGKWHWIMVGALMVLTFGLGGYVVDWSVRRRHGGFRI